MRALFIISWCLALVASLAFLWFGVYKLFTKVEAGAGLCLGVDVTWFVAGVLANLVVATIAVVAFRARWWAIGVALPGLTGVAVQLLLPCSFLLPILLPVVALVAIATGALVVAVWAMGRSEDR